METPLHAQKVAILSRLIKESSLTLEEALLLLKEEEENITIQPGAWHGTVGPTVPTLGSIYTTATLSGSTSITYSNDGIVTGATIPDLNS